MKFPIEYPYSRVPAWISKFAPIKVHAFSFGVWIFCRGAFSTRLRQHETIHFRQQLELGFILQWILYGAFWLWMFMKYRNAAAAYRNNPFEREAYEYDLDPYYLDERPHYAWIRHMKK